MGTAANYFNIVRDGDTLIVSQTADLRESIFEAHHEATTGLLASLDEGTTRHVVWDFGNTQTVGSTALGFFVKLWKCVCERRGKMAFCNLSAYEKEILHVTKMDRLWPLCDTLEDAVRAVREQP